MNDRYVLYMDRLQESDMCQQTTHCIHSGLKKQTWRNRSFPYDPITLHIYAYILKQYTFGTIFILNDVQQDGLTYWIFDMLALFDKHNTKVMTSNNPNNIVCEFNDVCLLQCPKPWFILTNNEHKFLDTLYHFGNRINPNSGDYLIVSNTNPFIPIHESICKGLVKLNQLTHYVEHSQNNDNWDWYVDTHMTDMFGYNSSFQWNSILVKRHISSFKKNGSFLSFLSRMTNV